MSEETAEQKPPVFSSWKGWYWLVLLTMVAQVMIYLMITQAFS